MSEFRDIVARIVERMRPECEQRDAWSVAEGFVPQIPEAMRDKMAVEFLVVAYFREDRHRELERPTKPKRRSPKRARLAADPLDTTEIDRRFWKSMNDALDTYTKHLRAEITAELLAESFTLDDGTSVTWGEATAHQHRVASMVHQLDAADHMQAASRHQAAIDMLAESGAASLAECMAQAA